MPGRQCNWSVKLNYSLYNLWAFRKVPGSRVLASKWQTISYRHYPVWYDVCIEAVPPDYFPPLWAEWTGRSDNKTLHRRNFPTTLCLCCHGKNKQSSRKEFLCSLIYNKYRCFYPCRNWLCLHRQIPAIVCPLRLRRNNWHPPVGDNNGFRISDCSNLNRLRPVCRFLSISRRGCPYRYRSRDCPAGNIICRHPWIDASPCPFLYHTGIWIFLCHRFLSRYSLCRRRLLW